MGNGNNGNGGVTVKLREKAEKILLSKYDRTVSNLKKKHKALTDKISKKVASEWGLLKLVTELVKIKEQAESLEEQIKGKLGSSYSYHDWENWKQNIFHGSKFEKEVKVQVNPQLDLEKEEEKLKELRDELLEELWLCGQSDEVKQVLAKMV